MRIPIAVAASLAVVLLVTGCTSFSSPEPPAPGPDMALARQTVKIYDTIPPNSTTVGEINATACDGGREIATDKLLVLSSQRGGNGIANITCASEGMSFSCWKSTACTATAVNVPPPPPPPPPPKRSKGKPKKR